MQKVRAIGIPWYREEDWGAIRSIMTDAHKLHVSHKDWLKAAEGLEQNIKRSGEIVERAYIDPDEFPGWCAVHGLNVDADGRNRFASEFVARIMGDSPL